VSLERRTLRWLCLLLGMSLWCGAAAHDARPVAVTLSEIAPMLYQARVQAPDTVAPAEQPQLRWPERCVATGPQRNAPRRCQDGLAGAALSLEFPTFNPALSVFYRIEAFDGSVLTAIVPPTDAVWTVPQRMSALQVALDYLWLGVEHIIGGFDHLLFVLGLLVIARTPRRILWTVTGFTLAHSLTLSLSALGLLRIPIPPVEATIALSIVFLAFEISRGRHDSLTWRHPMAISFGFGLLHGLGFASALGEIGLAPSQLLLSLLFFNLGVELGQVLFIVALLLLLACWRGAYHTLRATTVSARTTRAFELALSYLIGVPSAYWLIERVAGFGA